MADSDNLQALRRRIDELDETIQALISERAQCATQVATVKRASARGKVSYYRPEREAQVLRRIRTRNQGPLADRTMVRLFREIMAACLALEQPLSVAFLGPAGTFTQAATLVHFGHAVRTVALPAIADVFREVEADSAEFGVVPVENSSEGAFDRCLELFLHSSVRICGEVLLPCHQQLLSRAAGLKDIERIYAPQTSLVQCREWLDANLPQVERSAVASNGEAARLAARDSSTAAIAGEIAAEIHELSILARNIEDNPADQTRFLVIGKQPIAASGQDQTALLIATNNRPGLLPQLLTPLTQYGIEPGRIMVRPLYRQRWDRLIYLELQGHQHQTAVKEALAELGKVADFLKVLGSYPTETP